MLSQAQGHSHPPSHPPTPHTTPQVDLAVDMVTDQVQLVALNDASAGETLLTVPDSAWVSAETIRRTPMAKAVAGEFPVSAFQLQLPKSPNPVHH
jgi:hypothetical protein